MEEKTLKDVADTVYYNKENAEFVNNDGFITMKNGCEEKRVLLHRLFPFDELDSYISVLDTDKNELGMILSLNDFEGESRIALESELARKYFVQKICRINEIKDRHGFTYWKVISDGGRALEFTLHDTYRSMFRIGDDRIIITDVDGNRYLIESISGLDGASYKKVELYL